MSKLKSGNDFLGMRVNEVYEQILVRLRITTKDLISLKLFVDIATKREKEERLWPLWWVKTGEEHTTCLLKE